MLRCASALVVAEYDKSTPHSSGFARLASGRFTEPSKFNKFCFVEKNQELL
jgi:hypothetical protein